jgi:hypothetical protein
VADRIGAGRHTAGGDLYDSRRAAPGSQVTFKFDKTYPVYTKNGKQVFDVDMKAGDQGRIVEAVGSTCLVAGTDQLANGDMFATHVPCDELQTR